MSNFLKKNISTPATLVVILVTGAVGYYMMSLKKAPSGLNEFQSFTYSWGIQDTLENSYSSIDGSYQYLDKNDSLIRSSVKLRSNDVIFLHNRINELGFWTLPSNLGVADSDKKVLRYEIEFRYKNRNKKIVVYSNYSENLQLLDSVNQVRNLVQEVINDAESRYYK